jgi:hypothetical protein
MLWHGLYSCGLGYGPAAGHCEQGDEPSGFIKCWEIIETVDF